MLCSQLPVLFPGVLFQTDVTDTAWIIVRIIWLKGALGWWVSRGISAIKSPTTTVCWASARRKGNVQSISKAGGEIRKADLFYIYSIKDVKLSHTQVSFSEKQHTLKSAQCQEVNQPLNMVKAHTKGPRKYKINWLWNICGVKNIPKFRRNYDDQLFWQFQVWWYT